jgi:exopolyphosphatase/guanosine-5'-triphosphate,3'-diphosphate pyrophosphatase
VTRVGVLDLGTNSTRLLVADVGDGELHEVDRLLEITRLGEGVDAARRLAPAAVERVRATVARYARRMDVLAVERRVAVATSAVRDAANGSELLATLAADFGLEARLLSGDDEALLTFRGVSAGRSVAPGTLVIDVGGGSTELVLGGPGGVEAHMSLDLGCVRETERFLRSNPPAAEELAACAAHVRESLPAGLEPSTAIGVAGTVTTLATLHLGLAEERPELVHGHVLATPWIEAETAALAGRTVAELRRRPGIEHGRAPVLVAGCVVLLETLRAYGLEGLEVSERDILHGAALTLAG